MTSLTAEQTYEAVMGRQGEILRTAAGIDYDRFRRGRLVVDYEGLMASTGYTLQEIADIQAKCKVGNTPMLELHNLTRLARHLAPPGKGARIFVKDEAANASGSFKARRASLSVWHSKRLGYPGIIAATSGNYGAAVAAMAAMLGQRCIIVQEVYDSRGLGQPEIVEKGRACEAYGAEVWQTTVGPELFYIHLRLMEETGYFNASLYTPFSVAGIQTLGYEVGAEIKAIAGRPPAAVVVTHAGGGNTTGTALGLRAAGCPETPVIGASVNLRGLNMASDRDFNRKSFTTGHTGFGVPFLTNPDRTDVPYNAARPLRFLDRYVTVDQGTVFYVTQLLAELEGLERGPAGNTSLAAAFKLAQELPAEEVLVVQETEYTGAGKHPTAQLTFARENGVQVVRGPASMNVPGEVIAIPDDPSDVIYEEVDLQRIRTSYLRGQLARLGIKDLHELSEDEIEYLATETRLSVEDCLRLLSGAK
ncbi:MAG: 2-amino-4-oxopentanoate thiolase subunit OrtB [bacterium]